MGHELLSLIFTLIILALSVFQICLIFGAPFGEYAWGGDIARGSTHFVYGSFDLMRTSTGGGRHAYLIQLPEIVYVSPMDISGIQISSQNQDIDAIYSKNIFFLNDFKKYFTLYCTILFNSPTEAISLLHFFHTTRVFDNQGIWNRLEEYNYSCFITDNFSNNAIEFNRFEMMQIFRRFLFDYHLMPPACPEIQIRKSVKATQL